MADGKLFGAAVVVVVLLFAVVIHSQRESNRVEAQGIGYTVKVRSGSDPGILVIPSSFQDKEPFSVAVLTSLAGCMADFSKCKGEAVQAEYQGFTSVFDTRQAAWLAVAECLRSPWLCESVPEAASTVARIAATDSLVQATGGGPYRALSTLAPKDVAASQPTGDYTHPNGPLTHGTGLQPTDRRFPYADGGLFPFPNGVTSVQGVNQLDGGVQTFEFSNCSKIFMQGQGSAQLCQLRSPPGEIVCPPMPLQAPDAAPSATYATVTVLLGAWASNGFNPGARELTVSCGVDPQADPSSEAAIAKCVNIGRFCPERALEKFNACVRAVTGQYCSGNPNTVSGIMLNIYTAQLTSGTYRCNAMDGPGCLCAACKSKEGMVMRREAAWNAKGATQISALRVNDPGVLGKCGADFDVKNPLGTTQSIIQLKTPARALLWTRVPDAGQPAKEDPDCIQAPSCPIAYSCN